LPLFTCTVPGPAVGWRAPDVVQRGRHQVGVTPAKYAAWRTHATGVIRMAWRDQRGSAAPAAIDQECVLEVVFFMTRPRSRSKHARMDRKPDGSNLLKGIEDAMERAGVLINDSRITDGCYRKRYADDHRAAQPPHAEIALTW